jgi:hypothetical protein
VRIAVYKGLSAGEAAKQIGIGKAKYALFRIAVLLFMKVRHRMP